MIATLVVFGVMLVVALLTLYAKPPTWRPHLPKRKEKERQAPQFLTRRLCAGCGEPIVNVADSTQVQMLLPVDNTTAVPVTINICGVCVIDA